MEKLSTFELNRQVFHLFFGILIVLLLKTDFLGKKSLFLIIIFGLILSYLSKTRKIPLIYQLLKRFEREKDLKRFPGKGMIFYLIGAFISLTLFPKDIALASIMVLALGDSVSHLYGLHYGRIKHPISSTKFLEGTIAGIIAGFIGALIFIPWLYALTASLAAMIVESIEIKIGAEQVDDNLLIPFVAGAVVWIVRLAM